MNKIMTYIKENKADVVIGSILFALTGVVIVMTAITQQAYLNMEKLESERDPN